MSPPPQLPRINTRRVARVLCALAGGIHASAGDRADAAALEAAWPGARERIREVRKLHAFAAKWAVTEQGVRGLVVAASGFPCSPDVHTDALAVEPEARAVLADPDDEAVLINQAVLGRDPRVAAVKARALDAEGLLGCPEVQALPRPLFVLLPIVPALWTGEAAARALASYRRLMPSGSIAMLSCWIPDGGPAGEECLRQWRDRIGPIYGHRAQDIAAWLKDAGFTGVRPHVRYPRVEDVRVLTEEERWREQRYRQTHPGRLVKALARVP